MKSNNEIGVGENTEIGWGDLARSGVKQKKEIRRIDTNNEFECRGETVVVTIIIVFCSVLFLSAFTVGYICVTNS